jgi:hypothetical protein
MPDPNARYVAVIDAHLRSEAKPKAASVNHLLLGDWIKITGSATADGWVPVKARGDAGWLRTEQITATIWPASCPGGTICVFVK